MISTVVSCLPFSVNKIVPHSSPGTYFIPANANLGDMKILYVDNGTSLLYVGGDAGDNNNGWITRSVPSDEIASSIARDIISACINTIIGHAEPGIFWVPENVAEKDIKTKLASPLLIAMERQKRWLVELVKQADIDWARMKSPGVVSDLQRTAARWLQLKKEWDIERQVDEITNCPMCQSVVHPMAVICPNCKFILNRANFDKNKENFSTGIK